MTWVKLDNRAVHHTKLRRAGPVAGFLWIAGLSHCNEAANNGRIDKRDLRALYVSEHFTKRAATLAAQKLVEVGLWEDCGEHWQVHDYVDYQAPAMRDAVLERREKAAERKRAQRARERGETGSRSAQDLAKSGSYFTQEVAKNADVPSNIRHLHKKSRCDAAVSHTTPDPDLFLTAPSEQAAAAPPPPSVAKARRTRKLTALDETRLRLVAMFNEVYEPRFGGRSEPTSIPGCMAVVKAHIRDDGTFNEDGARDSMRAYFADDYHRSRNGYSFDGWSRCYAGSLSKARRSYATANQVNYDF